MAALGVGYDLAATTFSTDGRLFQVEYAGKAADNSGLVCALRVENGIVFAAEKLMHSDLLVPSWGKRIFTINDKIAIAISGLLPDARQLVTRARDEAANYKSQYGRVIPVSVLGDRLSLFMQMYTMYAAARPFGCSILLGGVTDGKPELFLIEPSGLKRGCYGMAVGKGKSKQEARNKVETLVDTLPTMDIQRGVIESAKIVLCLHDEDEDRHMELEVSALAADMDHAVFTAEQTEQITNLARGELDAEE
ncbi:Proteasome subunit alpha/beta [Carpediemonas membranifera]|uniref:Proteasome subunit alpha/beta n=1 Tax=Carpediemonas membranifera TaxID=201153 RepID=A0A8J6BE25_9EUKA|nr:Proteasome subunit alpha/beta [Carpediemonas membranifera]|eukprot:KAG9395547.1 Proteasome subunit alpha/beta [Carpediemonas membranifera]